MTDTESLSLPGRILWLTVDPERLRTQLGGDSLPSAPSPQTLLDRLSTDEILPAWACFEFDHSLGDSALVGLRGGLVEPCAIRKGGFSVMVSGAFQGTGSSREVAPLALLHAGIRLLVARSFERIYRQNCHALGLLTCTDFALIEPLLRGEGITKQTLLQQLEPAAREVVEAGGLLGYTRRRWSGPLVLNPQQTAPRPETRAETIPLWHGVAPRPQTLVEKILLSHSAAPREASQWGLRPRDRVEIVPDIRFSHDYVTAMIDALYREGFGQDAALADPGGIVLFADHLTLFGDPRGGAASRPELLAKVRRLTETQREFARRHGLRLLESAPASQPSDDLGHGICHLAILERLARPGMVIVGTDSHTPTAGALGCLGFGIGSTEMACALRTGTVSLTVPESLRIELVGKLPAGVMAKDVMLHLLGTPRFRQGWPLSRVLEFSGPGLDALCLDERATLCCMAVEAGAFSALVDAAPALGDLATARGVSEEEFLADWARADPHAEYADRLTVDLSEIRPMVALPGDPHQTVPLQELLAGPAIPIDIAYAGSCTGAKWADIEAVAAVVAERLARGNGLPARVRFYVQFGSVRIRRCAEQAGHVELFQRAGIILLEPACGACIRAGPGVSTRQGEVTVSATNRNFTGRSGPGAVYLTNPTVVAASAFAGRLAVTEERA